MTDGCRCERCKAAALEVEAIMHKSACGYQAAREEYDRWLVDRQKAAHARKRSLTPVASMTVQQLREIWQSGKAPPSGSNGGG